MLRFVYTVFTTYEGMYLCYLVPVVYFLAITFTIISSKMKRRETLKGQDIVAAGAILLVLLDFGRYLYLFLTHTGRLLPLPYLFLKYVVGGLVWLWILWYCYQGYFARRVAGASFARRWAILLGICAAGLVFALIGIAMS
jgi:hypothetical protein